MKKIWQIGKLWRIASIPVILGLLLGSLPLAYDVIQPSPALAGTWYLEGSSQGQAQEQPAASLFENYNYVNDDGNTSGNGVAHINGPASYANLDSLDFDNDTLSSVKVKKDWKLTLYENENFGGKSVSYSGPIEVPNVGDNGSFNDMMTSFKIESTQAPGPPAGRLEVDDPGAINAYEANNPSARDWNDRNAKTSFEIRNTSPSGAAAINWSATTNADWIELSPTDGTLSVGGKITVRVKAQPPGIGTHNMEIRVMSDVGNTDPYMRLVVNAAALQAAPVRMAPDFGSNGRVNAAVNAQVTFKVNTVNGISGYKWVTDDRTITTPKPEADLSFSQLGNSDVKVYVVDNNNVEGYPLSIPVAVWKLPTVDEVGTGVSWRDGKYVGVVGQPVTLQATGQKGSDKADESIAQFRWDLDSNWATVEVTQTAGQTAQYTWPKATLAGRARVKAVTNYGIVSDERLFDIKIYDTVTVDTGGPYSGRPLKEVALKGTHNQAAYPGASVVYQWRVLDGTWKNVTTDNQGAAKYTWSTSGDFQAKLSATVTTSEGLILSGEETTTVKIETGRPSAMPGGPYQGGIEGGNYSPIQFSGNPPDYIEAEDIGYIVDWQWFFADGSNKALEFDGVNDYVSLGNPTALQNTGSQTIELWLRPKKVDRAQVLYLKAKNGEGAITLEADGKVTFHYGNGTNSQAFVMTSTLEPNVWTHLAIVRDLSARTLKWYKNGILTDQATASYASAAATSATAYIGKSDGAYSSFLGAVDEFAVWNLALSEAEIQQHLLSGLKRTQLGLVGYWPFEEITNNTTPDVSSSKNPGSLVNMAGNLVDGHPACKRGLWNPTHVFPKAGQYQVTLRVKSQYGKWSLPRTAVVQVVDGTVAGYVRAADLRTPVKDVCITLTSDHVDVDVLARIVAADPRLHRNDDGSIWTLTDEMGYYAFEHIPLGTYRVVANKVNGDIHDFEVKVKVTELTLKTPNSLAVDFVDITVFPVGGRVLYSIQKDGADVLVDSVSVEAFPIGSNSSVRSLPSASSLTATGTNYSVPLFSGKYLFLASREGHDIRISETIPDYDANSGLVLVRGARTDVDFIDHTTRNLSVYVVDSGGYPVADRDVTISGTNGAARGKSDAAEGKFEVTLNPGKYTVTVPGAMPKGERSEKPAEVDVTGGDQVITMVVPAKIVLEISPEPNLLDSNGEAREFLKKLGLTDQQIQDMAEALGGYMYFWPPEPRTHAYTVKATANGQPVEDFNLVVTDEVSQMTADPPVTQSPMLADGDSISYKVTAGLPKLDRSVDPPVAAPKWIRFQASKEGYLDSDMSEKQITILGDVPVGTATRLVSVPNVNYLVLHDPPGDGSFSYLDDSTSIKGWATGMELKLNGEGDVPVYPSPWTSERSISGYSSSSTPQDLEMKGLLGTKTASPAGAPFGVALAYEMPLGMGLAAVPGVGFVLQLVKVLAIDVPLIATSGDWAGVQYEISPNRHLETASDDEIPDIMGPGKGDIYYGEGWTLGLQTKYRLGIKLDTVGGTVVPDTQQIETYDIMERKNQYVYTTRDIERIITDLTAAIAQSTDQAEKAKLQSAKNTWNNLLQKNLAYRWEQEGAAYLATGKKFDDWAKENGLTGGETLIFSGGPTFDYSRTINMSTGISFSKEAGVSSAGEFGCETEIEAGFKFMGSGTSIKWAMGSNFTVEGGVSLGMEWESGKGAEQTVGFALKDGDVGDNYATRVYKDPVWGTPLFFTEAGSVTSDPWEPGTNKAVDLTMELVQQDTGTFDYREGAHYKVKLQYAGQRELDSSGVGFLLYDSVADNTDGLTIRFNGQAGPYAVELSKQSPVATVNVSVYPPEVDQRDSSAEKQYTVTIAAQEEDDDQIGYALVLQPTFADLRAPRATISAPYDGQRISPVLFPAASPFEILVVSEDTDLASIQLQIRSKRPDGVWEPWYDLSGILWQDGVENPAVVTVFDRMDRVPPRREFTFYWPGDAIRHFPEGEYALRAVATDKATQPNRDIDPPSVVFRIDGTKPSVLNTVPDYQATEGERIYASELSATFTDDMRFEDFTDRAFLVTDLLNNNALVAGYVSYVPALRKAVFVPVVPFKANGFYRVVIKTDTPKADGSIDRGVHDLAGNPLDNVMIWTFHTKGVATEPSWSVTLSVTDGTATDANNIAGVEYGASDFEDEKDARKVGSLAQLLRLSFLNRQEVAFSRDIRPADGRLSYHWPLVVSNPKEGSEVTILWQPSNYLVRSGRDYQILRLVEFDKDGNVANTIPLDPSQAVLNLQTGLYEPMVAYTYRPAAGETSRRFRLDVQKSELVVANFIKGSSGWVFFSVPIMPQVADPFVNLGDDINPLQVYWYDTESSSYKIYPLDLGEVALQPGRGYFTYLTKDAVVDVGGAAVQEDVTRELKAAGLHAIGNPFVLPVAIGDLKVNGMPFAEAVAQGLVGGTLFRWKLAVAPGDVSDVDEPVSGGLLQPWKGYWLETKAPNLTLTIPVPHNTALLLDSDPPTSTVLSANTMSPTVKVVWSGSDNGSGVKWYDIQYKDGPNGTWTNWLTGTTSTTAVFPGEYGHTYYFRSRAQDNAGNWESYPQGDGDVSIVDEVGNSSQPTNNNGASVVTTVTGPTLTVTSPNGGQTWAAGSKADITWSSAGVKGKVKIEMSRNGGQTWTTIVSSTPNDGKYTWEVNAPATSQARIKITSVSTPAASDTSDADFTITGPTLTVTSPNGGQTWAAGSKAAITWSSAGVKGKVKIEMSRNGGQSWTTIVSSTPNDGKHTWEVNAPATSQARIKITGVSTPAASDTSDADFTITGPSITVTGPNGGQTWAAGSKAAITWSSTGVKGKVKIELSRDGGQTWTTIVSSTPNDGSHTWKVSGPATSQARIRITGVSTPAASDTSNADFTIAGP